MKLLRKHAFFCTAAILAALAACQQPPSSDSAATEAATEAAGPDARPGIAASDGRMVLPVVAGRPAAVYFSVRNDGAKTATLAGVHVAGAGTAEMHKTEGGTMSAVGSVDLGPGATVEFAPGGYHVMAFDLSDTLKAGETTELTLTFSDGDKLSMPLRIEKMGAGMSASGQDMGGHDMEGHDMKGMHH